MKITDNSTVEEAIKKSNGVFDVFKKYNLYCPVCKGSRQDTIRVVAVNNGLPLDALLQELNETIKR